MNMSDDDTNHQFDDQVNELLAQTLEVRKFRRFI